MRDYLVSQGVAQPNVTAMGYGKNDPIADNSTNDGRAQNRRVQMVVSGSSIVVQEQAPGSSGDAALPVTNNPPTAQNSGISNPPQQ